MQLKLLKYILDIESVIEEIESIKLKTQNDFNNFTGDIILQRAVERGFGNYWRGSQKND